MLSTPGITSTNVRNPPEPAQNILDLLLQYNIKYPGNAVQAPDINYTTIQTSVPDETTTASMLKFLRDIYPQMQPTELTDAALSYSDEIYTDPNTTSNIFNFGVISNNDYGDIIPPGTAIALNAAVTELERNFSPYALDFIMGIFTTHIENITTNPHHDTTLLNVWNDFFQYLYNKYIQLITNAVSLNEFISEKTSDINPTTLAGWMTTQQQAFAVTLQVAIAIIAQHNAATDATIHPGLQDELTSTVILPRPMLVISADQTEVVYYNTSLYNTFPQAMGSIFINANIDLTSNIAISLLKFSNSISNDSFEIIKKTDTNTGYHVIITVSGVATDTIIPTNIGSISIIVNYNASGIEVLQWDGSNMTNTGVTINNALYDYTSLQLGMALAQPGVVTTNTIQEIMVFPAILSLDQINLLFNS